MSQKKFAKKKKNTPSGGNYTDILLEKVFDEVKLIGEQHGDIIKKIDGLDSRIDGLDGRIDSLDNRIDGLDNKIDSLDNRIDGLDGRIDSLDNRIDGLDSRIDSLDKSLNKRIDNLDISLNRKIENLGNKLDNFIVETRENFKLIGEHLSRIEDDFLVLRKKIEKLDKEKVSIKEFNWLKEKVLEIEDRLEKYKKQQTALAAKS